MINYGFSISKGIYLEGNNSNIFVLQTKDGYKKIESKNKSSLIFILKKLFYMFIYSIPSILCFGSLYSLYEEILIWLMTGSFNINLFTFYFYLSFFLVSLLVIKFYSKFPQYHAAEHMVIEFIEENGIDSNLSIENVRKMNRISISCSTRFLVPLITFHLFFIIITTLTSVNGSIIVVSLLATMLLIEIKNLTPDWYRTFSYRTSLFIQEKLTTKEPNDEQLALAIYAAKNSLGLN